MLRASYPPKDTETARLIKMMHMKNMCSPKQTVMAKPLTPDWLQAVPSHGQDSKCIQIF